MDLSDVRDHVDRQCEFPIDHATLVAEVGDVSIDAPTTDTETIGTILDRTSETRFRSSDALYMSLIGNVDASFVGPRNYDDRAGARSVPEDRDPRTA